MVRLRRPAPAPPPSRDSLFEYHHQRAGGLKRGGYRFSQIAAGQLLPVAKHRENAVPLAAAEQVKRAELGRDVVAFQRLISAETLPGLV
jgi:hypothetical protein